jgi:hypothetical protein
MITDEKLGRLFVSLKAKLSSKPRWEISFDRGDLTLTVTSSIEKESAIRSSEFIICRSDEFWTPIIKIKDGAPPEMVSPYKAISEAISEIVYNYDVMSWIYLSGVRGDIKLLRQLVEYPRESPNLNHKIRDEQSFRLIFETMTPHESEETGADENEPSSSSAFSILRGMKSSPNAEQQALIIKQLPVISFTESSLSNGRVTIKTKNGSYFGAPGTYCDNKGLHTIFADKSNLPARCKTAITNPSLEIVGGDAPLVK